MNGNLKMALYRFRYLIILFTVMLILTLGSPRFLSFKNFTNILWAVSIIGIMSIGGTFVILVGKVDLSVGQIAALSALTASTLLKHGMSIPAAIFAALLVGVAAGAINGIIVGCIGIPDFITTLATGKIIIGIAQMVSNGKTISVMDHKGYTFIGSGKILDIPMPLYFFALTFGIGYFILNYTIFGRNCYSVGGNPKAAKVCNVSVKKTIVVSYLLVGLAASFGGIILNSLNQQANASLAGGYELDVIASVVIGGASMAGGVGTMPGTIFGVILIGLINNGLNLLSVPGSWHPVVKGVIIIAAVAFNNYSLKLMQMKKSIHEKKKAVA